MIVNFFTGVAWATLVFIGFIFLPIVLPLGLGVYGAGYLDGDSTMYILGVIVAVLIGACVTPLWVALLLKVIKIWTE